MIGLLYRAMVRPWGQHISEVFTGSDVELAFVCNRQKDH